jgi:hypothetical protein
MASHPGNSSTDNTLFRLVSELTLEERNNFLEKLKGQSTMSFDSLYEGGEDTQETVFEVQYARLPWYYRLGYFILSFFKSRPALKIFEDSKVGRLARKIEAEAPGLYDFQRNLLLPVFYQQMADLKEAARFFYTALDTSVNRDKGSFYVFLGSLEMGEVHRHLLENTAPGIFFERMPEATETEIRQAALKAMEDAFAQITETQRNIMYFNARSLHCLKELSAFLFDRVLLTFGSGKADGGMGQTCSANVVRELLGTLNNILFSLKEPPTLSLLESLFVFRLQERRRESGFDMDREMRTLLSRAENAITIIRTFNRRVPLAKILRCVTRDLSLSPSQISGGENWFQVYREHWKQQIENSVADYFRQCKQREVFNSFRHFLKGTNLKVLENVVSDANPNGLPVPEAFTLAFLQTFHAAVFMGDVNNFLRPVLLDGEFIKKENRAEFTSAYNDIMQIADNIKKFDFEISPEGDYGNRYIQARDDMSSLQIKRRKIQLVLGEVSNDASRMITRVHDSMKVMIKVLGGILSREPDAKYGRLINLEKIAGKNLEAFRKGIADSIGQFNQALQILSDIEAMGNLW